MNQRTRNLETVNNLDHKKYIEEYLHNLERMNKSEHTIKNYRADLVKFITWLEQFKAMHIGKVNGDIIGEYKEFLHSGGAIYDAQKRISKFQLVIWFQFLIFQTVFKKRTTKSLLFFQSPLGVGSRRRHLSSLKNFFEYLKETHEDHSDLFARNPVKSKIHAIKLKDIDVASTKLIKKNDFYKCVEKSFRTKDRLMLYLLYYGAMRLSELCFLKKIDFDFESQTVSFKRKGGSIHQLKIINGDLIFSHLRFYLNLDTSNSEYLFHNKFGAPFTNKTMYNQIMKILKRAEIANEITPHSFRKACATNLYKETKDLLFVRDYLNHSDAKVTQTYIDIHA